MPFASAPAFLDVGQGNEARRIAWRGVEGAAPTLLWLGGYRSDMLGTKAERLSGIAEANGLCFRRFDYSGHGESGGRFEDGTISRWLEESEAVLAGIVPAGPVVAIGSSMGAWIALRLAQRLRGEAAGRHRLQGLLLLAPAPDFTERLVRPKLSAANLEQLAREGLVSEPSRYSDFPTIYTQRLLDDGERNLVMERTIETGCPVHILQGMADPDAPFAHALDLVSHLPSDGVTMTLIKDGDHRLSRPQDLDLMERAVLALAQDA